MSTQPLFEEPLKFIAHEHIFNEIMRGYGTTNTELTSCGYTLKTILKQVNFCHGVIPMTTLSGEYGGPGVQYVRFIARSKAMNQATNRATNQAPDL